MPSDYIHGYSPSEQQRLTLMQTILNDRELERLDLEGVTSILDVGAGLGQMTRAMARAAGQGTRVVGIERDERQIAEAKRQAAEAGETGLVELRRGDATDLPLAKAEWGTFDLAHTRFLLEHVTDPLAVVREMVRAVRPGGRVMLIDDDHELLRFSPDCSEMDQIWEIFWQAFRVRGQDPLIGRRLPQLLHHAGCRNGKVDAVFYGATRGMEIFDPVVDNLIGVLEGAAESLDSSGHLARQKMTTGLDALGRWRKLEGATVWYSLPMAEGIR